MRTVAIVGAGATGTRIARQLERRGSVDAVVLVDDGEGIAATAARSIGSSGLVTAADEIPRRASVVVVATRANSHVAIAHRCVEAGQHVVSVGDSITDVRGLLDLDEHAQAHGVKVVVGAGLMPGLSDVLAELGRAWFDDVREIHVSKFGTGGPDCARQHHRALKGLCFDWEKWRVESARRRFGSRARVVPPTGPSGRLLSRRTGRPRSCCCGRTRTSNGSPHEWLPPGVID